MVSLTSSSAKPAVMGPVSPADYCGYVSSSDGTSSSYTKIGELHNTSDASAYFNYGSTADSVIGAGFSYDPESNWTANGSVSINNYVSTHVTKNVSPGQWPDQGYQLLSQFTYARTYYYSLCGSYTPYYTENATSWDAGGELGANVSSADNHPNQWTVAFQAGFGFTRSTNSAFTYNFAYNVFGASLTARSGFSSTVFEQWHFNNYTQYLYGNNNWPTSSTIIYAAG